MAEKQITLTAGENDLKFNITTTDYNNFVNEFKPDDKVAPSTRLLRRTLVDKEKQRELLDELCDAGLAVELAAALIQEFKPKLEIEVKK